MNSLIKQLAEGVMGWDLSGGRYQISKDGRVIKVVRGVVSEWDPLEDWNDCMMLVEQMREDGWVWEIRSPNTIRTEKYVVHFYKDELDGICVESDLKEAICMATAKAIEIDIDSSD